MEKKNILDGIINANTTFLQLVILPKAVLSTSKKISNLTLICVKVRQIIVSTKAWGKKKSCCPPVVLMILLWCIFSDFGFVS